MWAMIRSWNSLVRCFAYNEKLHKHTDCVKMCLGRCFMLLIGLVPCSFITMKCPYLYNGTVGKSHISQTYLWVTVQVRVG